MAFNLSVTVLSAKAVCSQGVTPFFLHLAPLAGEVGAKRRVRGTVRETGPVELTLPSPREGRGEEGRREAVRLARARALRRSRNARRPCGGFLPRPRASTLRLPCGS